MTIDHTQLTLDDMVDRRQAAEIMRCHVNTVDKLRRNKHLTGYRMPGRHKVYFVRAQVEQYNQPVPMEDAS